MWIGWVTFFQFILQAVQIGRLCRRRLHLQKAGYYNWQEKKPETFHSDVFGYKILQIRPDRKDSYENPPFRGYLKILLFRIAEAAYLCDL
jgi:hypothetical protein